MAKTKKQLHTDGLAVKGFFRIQIVDNKGVVGGDSGWKENQVTNLGINQYVVNWLLGDTANGKSITHAALGTGAAPASNDTALSGELTHSTSGRASVSTSVVASRTAQFTGAFNSANSFVTASANISNIGLFNTSTTNIGTVFAGNTYASSSCAKLVGTYTGDGIKKFFQSRWNPRKRQYRTKPIQLGRRNDWMEDSRIYEKKVQSELYGDIESIAEMTIPLTTR